jgi:hypothetical protein
MRRSHPKIEIKVSVQLTKSQNRITGEPQLQNTDRKLRIKNKVQIYRFNFNFGTKRLFIFSPSNLPVNAIPNGSIPSYLTPSVRSISRAVSDVSPNGFKEKQEVALRKINSQCTHSNLWVQTFGWF